MRIQVQIDAWRATASIADEVRHEVKDFLAWRGVTKLRLSGLDEPTEFYPPASNGHTLVTGYVNTDIASMSEAELKALYEGVRRGVSHPKMIACVSVEKD